MVAAAVPSHLCNMTLSACAGCLVSPALSVGAVSKSGFIGFVGKVLWRGCQPAGSCGA